MDANWKAEITKIKHFCLEEFKSTIKRLLIDKNQYGLMKYNGSGV